jgi:hypothetical protein
MMDARINALSRLCLLDISDLLRANKNLPEKGQQFLDAIEMFFSGEGGATIVESLKDFVRSEKDVYGLTAVDEALLAAVHPVFFADEPLTREQSAWSKRASKRLSSVRSSAAAGREE